MEDIFIYDNKKFFKGIDDVSVKEITHWINSYVSERTGLYDCSSLKELYLYENKLKTLPESIKKLEKRGIIIFK